MTLRGELHQAARTGAGRSVPPAGSAAPPWCASSMRIWERIARVRSSPAAGGFERCDSRWSPTCCSVSATKPKLVAISHRGGEPRRVPEDPRTRAGSSRLVASPSSSMRSAHHARWSPSSRAARATARVAASRSMKCLPVVEALGRDLPAWFTRIRPAIWRFSGVGPSGAARADWAGRRGVDAGQGPERPVGLGDQGIQQRRGAQGPRAWPGGQEACGRGREAGHGHIIYAGPTPLPGLKQAARPGARRRGKALSAGDFCFAIPQDLSLNLPAFLSL